MPEKPNPFSLGPELRVKAERLAGLEGLDPALRQSEDVPSSEAMKVAMHELSVHQIELELQNAELLRTQEALEVSRERYFELYDLAPVGYLTIGENGVVKEANLTATKLLGVTRSQLEGRHFSHFIASEDQDSYYLWRRQLLNGDKPKVCELRLFAQDVQSFWAHIEASVVPDREGIPMFHVIISDISERKRAELENERLQTQLAQAQKMEAIGSLASGIAHDFNNILTGVMGGLSLLEGELTHNSQKQDIAEMQELIGQATHLTRALLGFARRGKVNVQPLDLKLEVDEIATMFGRTRKDIVIQTDAAPGLHSVLMDRTQLGQALLNLFINAAQAMPKGGKLLVSMANEETPDKDHPDSDAAIRRFVKLIVADTGVGMDEATQLRIFEPFFTTKKTGEGNGLGLASVYGIVESHGGHIQVESCPGEGTAFNLHLLATDELPRPKTVPPVTVEGGHETILVVDDEEYVRKVYTRMLKKLGYTILTASSGAQALELAQQHRDTISLVILDMTMPQMSGPDTFQALRIVTPSIRVLFSSGHSLEKQAQQVHVGGCNGFLQKPFDIATLAVRVRQAMGSV